jgi:UDP-3-O-[3-hydroxymyristoyl] glucosamine N-acyltransferase
MTLGEIATRLGLPLEGDAQTAITGVAGIEEAGPGELTFVGNPRYRPALATTRASAVILSTETAPAGLAVLRSKNPHLDFARAIELFHQPPRYEPGVHPTAVIAPTAALGPDAHVGPHCYIADGVRIGARAVLHSHVVIYAGATIGDDFFAHSHAVVREGSRIGHRVTLQTGAVVGSDGFGYARLEDGRWRKIHGAGPAVLEDDVEVQAHACIDRATVGETRIRRGAKIDNLVQVGHACDVGEDALLCAQTGLAGSCVVQRRAILAGQVGLAGHLTVGEGAILTAQTGVHQDIPAGAIYSGYPAIENKRWLRCSAAYKQLPELVKSVRELQAEVERLRVSGGAAE